jgi:hypothetical protein
MHPHGVKYDKDSEGAYYQPDPGRGAAVAPGAKFTYVWSLDDASGPLPHEPSSKGWLYHSHVEGDDETNLGLVGFLIVTDPKRARPDGTPRDVDREMAALFMIFDESGLGQAAKEAAEYAAWSPTGGAPLPWSKVQEVTEQGERAAINGYIFGNLPGLEAIEGERVRWHLFGLGSEVDAHTAHWHGFRVIEEGRRTDVVELLPASMKVVDMTADNPGQWLFHCHVAHHMMEGMFARFVVHPRTPTNASLLAGAPFFGLSDSRTSIRITRLTSTLNTSPEKIPSRELTLTGTVSVYEAFSVFAEPITARIGNLSFSFHSDRQGAARTANIIFQAKTSNRFGVIYGGLMDFELTIHGPELLSEFQRFGGANLRSPWAVMPFALQIGESRHTASVFLNQQ